MKRGSLILIISLGEKKKLYSEKEKLDIEENLDNEKENLDSEKKLYCEKQKLDSYRSLILKLSFIVRRRRLLVA